MKGKVKVMKAQTQKGRIVSIETEKVGTAGHKGILSFGDVPVAFWCTTGSQKEHSLEEALISADEKIDRCRLQE